MVDLSMPDEFVCVKKCIPSKVALSSSPGMVLQFKWVGILNTRSAVIPSGILTLCYWEWPNLTVGLPIEHSYHSYGTLQFLVIFPIKTFTFDSWSCGPLESHHGTRGWLWIFSIMAHQSHAVMTMDDYSTYFYHWKRLQWSCTGHGYSWIGRIGLFRLFFFAG